MKKFKRILIILIITFSITNILSIKVNWFKKELLFQNLPKYYTGDLFEINKVLTFRNKIYKIKEKEEEDTLEDCEIITMGDSFFTANFDSPIFSDLLEDKYNFKVYNVPRDELADPKINDNPLKYLKQNGYIKGKKKYLILETVERYSIERGVEYVAPVEIANLNVTSPKTIGDQIKGVVPKESLNYFFHNSLFVSPFEQLANSFKFKVLKEIDPQTPVYTKDYSQVFHREDIAFSKRIKNDDDINAIANNISYLRDQLRDLYNIELIYMVVPNKYSIYGDETDDPLVYDNYIPRLTTALNKKGVNTFDLYTQYKNISKETLLYFKGDTHFTPEAKIISLENSVNIIKSKGQKNK